jgi:hypothetical protein
MKVSYIFTATGKYARFIPKLVETGIKNFFPDDEVDFVVFTDSEEYDNVEKLTVIKTQKMGWPFDTLKRFHLINSNQNILKSDFLFYGNANIIFNSEVSHEILPNKSDNWIVGTIHPSYLDTESSSLPYERNEKSTACVKYGEEGQHYYQGCFFGGEREHFLKMSEIIEKNIDQDLSNNFIAEWWDESHMNKYFIENPPKSINPGYAYPEFVNIPFDKKIIQLDKSKLGGHAFLRE